MRFLRILPLMLLSGSVSIGATPLDLMRLAPQSQNAFCFVNIESLLKTPRAKKEGWDKNDRTEYLAGCVPFHPSAEEILATTEFRGSKLQGSGSTLIVPLKKPVDLANVAKAVAGTPTTLGDLPAVKSQNGMYIVPLEENLLGAMNAEHRQELGRWVRGVKEKTSVPHSKYLLNAANNLGRDHVTIAVDVDDMFDTMDVSFALALNPELAKDKKTADTIGRYLTGIKGIRLLANFSDAAIQLTVAFDGTINPGVPADVLKDAIVELVERAGAGFRDLRAAQARADGIKYYLTFNVTDDEFSHIMAVFFPPMELLPSSETIAIAPGTISAETTKKYFLAVNKIVDDLRKKSVDSPTDYLKTALWHDTAIRRIEAISTIGVDPIAVQYARGTEALIAAVSDSLRGVPIQYESLNRDAYSYTYVQPGFRPWWNRTWTQTNLPEIWEKQRGVIKSDQENRKKVWEKIEQTKLKTYQDLNKK